MENEKFIYRNDYLQKEIVICSENCNKLKFCKDNNINIRNIDNQIGEFRIGDFILINNKPNFIYVVLPGDTLQSIANKFNINIEELIKKNKINNIFIGQQLSI